MQDSLLPKITLITPSFNQGQYLEKCIRSVVNQGYPNLEYMIFDGGSTDNSVEIIKKYEPFLSYWQSEPDGGQSAAIKKGFSRGQGQIYSWINSDDFLCHEALFKIANAFSKNPQIGLVYGNCFVVNEQGNFLYSCIPEQATLKELIHRSMSVFQGSTFYSKKAYETVGGINSSLKYAMEYELLYKITESFPILYLSEFLGCFRIQPLSKGKTMAETGKSEILDILYTMYKIKGDSFWFNLTRYIYISRRRLRNPTFIQKIFNKNSQIKLFEELVKS